LIDLREIWSQNWLYLSSLGLLTTAGLIRFATKTVAQRRFSFSDYDRRAITPGYRDRRGRDIARTPSELGLSSLGDSAIAHGVVIDFGDPAGIATLVAFANGQADFYGSTGLRLVDLPGSPQPDRLESAAKTLVRAAQVRLPMMTATADFRLPKIGRANLFVLTQNGVFADDIRMRPVEAPVRDVWNAGQALLEVLKERTCLADA
jgi:hypothetical protein